MRKDNIHRELNWRTGDRHLLLCGWLTKPLSVTTVSITVNSRMRLSWELSVEVKPCCYITIQEEPGEPSLQSLTEADDTPAPNMTTTLDVTAAPVMDVKSTPEGIPLESIPFGERGCI